ncbi:ADP-ribosylation factor 6 [Metarhizium anisopliae]|nr:ADP-ribosylation factor 6 [Metarhizium anisopliae]
MEEAKQELHRIINDREMKDSLLLVFANKQDLDDGTYTFLVPTLAHGQSIQACDLIGRSEQSNLSSSHDRAKRGAKPKLQP